MIIIIEEEAQEMNDEGWAKSVLPETSRWF